MLSILLELNSFYLKNRSVTNQWVLNENTSKYIGLNWCKLRIEISIQILRTFYWYLIDPIWMDNIQSIHTLQKLY